MVGTRRKSKAAAAAAADLEHDGSSQATDEHLSNVPLNVPIPVDVDAETLASLLPDTSITSPTPENIVSLYRLLLAQGEIDRKDVELDQALQDRESQTREYESSLEIVHNQLNDAKREREQLGECRYMRQKPFYNLYLSASSKAELEAQLSSVSNSQSSTSVEVVNLKHRVEDAEREKRDLMGVISRLKEDSSQREEEIQTLRANLKQARQDHQSLETQARELRSSETSNKFKVDSLTQQLQLSQTETERATKELNSKVEEFAKYRRSKHSEISHLQASYDSLVQTRESTESSHKALQSAHTTQSHQLTQALARVQDLSGQLAEQEAAFSSEASGLKRLVTVMEDREQQTKGIVENIEKEWAARRAREETEKRVEQLETVLDRVGRGELPIPGRGTPVPGTPGNIDHLSDGMLGLSPTVAMVSKAQRGGKTFTDVYADYVRLQDEFAKKSAEYDHMDRTLSAVLAQIEERAPILSQQRAEYERLQSEAAQLASQLSQALSERDSQSSVAQETSQKLKRSNQETELLQRQLDDLGRQVQVLLKELGRQQDPSIPSDEVLDQMPPPAENIDAVITNNLVLFRSIGELQEQNQKLLKIVRELGTKMETEEKEYREALEREQSEAVREAHEAIQDLATQLERQKKSSEVTIQAYMKERDALKAMLARADRPFTNGSADSNAVSSMAVSGAPSSDLVKELEDTQAQFESFKTEMGTDSTRLREELVVSQREVGQLNTALAKANAKIEYLNDRQRMNQEQLNMQSRELDNFSKRNQQLYDQFTRIDIECNRASEDLLVERGHVEQLRNECANLRAEKKIWESVQGRLVDENKSLAIERAHLSDLMSNVQKMHNDLERSGENDRRRLENQIQMMESQTQDLRGQLSQERDSVRHISLQKDIELKELHSRLDKSVEELSKTRESLVGAETSRNHLQERVDELARQLQGNAEKLSVYERRPGSVNGPSQTLDQGIPREQQLEQEVAELRSALKVMEVDLTAARSHMQQFQEISQANEAALTTLSSTHEEYKTNTEAQLARNELEYTALQDKVHSVERDLTQSTDKINELQRSLESERAAWANDKKTLEDTIVDISTSERHSDSDRTSRENELRLQEERAIAAEDRYSREVLAHAESIKAIEAMKQQLSTVQVAARDNLAAASTAEAKLAASEGSWKQQKEALDKEVADLNTRCKDLAAQNTLLHQHLESVSSQAARIKQAADTSAAPHGENEMTVDADTKLSELRSVVAYLRKEKEIVDLQLELCKQENVRLKAQIDHLSQSLDETRATLSEERERAVEAASSDAQHAELLERINQLNILRESNATLRTDCETYAKRARELDTKLKQLSSEFEPAKEQARLAQAELQARNAQITRLEDESRRWQERNSQLLSKYDRIDPADVQSLKEEIETLKSQKAEAEQMLSGREAEFASQTQRTEALEANVRKFKESHARNAEAVRQRLGLLNNEKSQLNATVAELRAQVKTLTTERDAIQSSAAPVLTSGSGNDLTDQVESLRKEKNSLEKALADEKATKNQPPVDPNPDLVSTIAALREERDRLLAEKETSSKTPASSVVNTEESKGQWEKEKNELVKARDEALSQARAADEQIKKATEENKNIRFSNEKLQIRMQDISKARAAEKERLEAAVTAAEKAKNDLQASGSGANSEDASKRHADELEALRLQLNNQYEADLKIAVEAAVAAAKAENVTTSASNSGADQKAAINTAIAAHDQQLQAKHTEEIAAAVERGRREQSVKGKLKDAQLVRAQTKLKELEAQILEWRKAGKIPEPSAVPTTPTAASGSTAPPTTATVKAPAPSTQPSSVPAANAARRQPTSGAVHLGPSATGGVATRGRGSARGARGGAQRALAIRGAAPATGQGEEGASSVAAAPAAGVSIVGAASKRSREEGEPDDSLAKRLKPAPEAPGTSKPVSIRRPPADS
ncbi:hypothetical protein SERLA73DRAFT_169454 [Serpula lacrymans var. lacrymans S7.3]|uniref:Uncharacterized protein n=1 Tax=Serpula lacrymans var. lacrymans (strain S7.3) TaxID=936435 RepID=F8Q028_SERL3|nr:hypothetical protein SERLA73DRAFT_169454 [Serpula lacrymans var. lacrymans S7.3]